MPELDPQTTALVAIDLQKGILARELAPHPSEQVIRNTRDIAGRVRQSGALVVLVNVAFAKDFKDALRQPVDQPTPLPPGGFPAHFSELVDGLQHPEDILITKRQWGAFHGTELDLLLRRRGIRTVVLTGVATNIGVESTARQAWEHGYAIVFAEDAISAMSAEMHEFAVSNIFPRLGRVVKSAEVIVRAA